LEKPKLREGGSNDTLSKGLGGAKQKKKKEERLAFQVKGKESGGEKKRRQTKN